MMIRRLLLLLSAILFFFQSFSQEIGKPAKKIAEYDSTYRFVPKEKIYLHFDKSVYAPGDTIWFKAYLIDPATNMYTKQSGVIHVEIVAKEGLRIQSLSLPVNLGISWGSFVLHTDNYPPGNYTVSAYTNWIQNFDDAFFFTKQIQVINIPSPTTSTTTRTIDKTNIPGIPSKETQARKNPAIQFLPEGGTWIVHRLQKIGFKAINPSGKGIAVEGEIKDSRLRTLTQFKSNQKGMGHFSLIAEPNEVYTAYLKIGNEKYNYVLEAPKSSGTSLFVKNDFVSDSLVITVISDLPDQELTVLGQSRGALCFSAVLPAEVKRRTLKIAKKLFPSGIAQIVLQGKDRVYNERRTFIRHPDQLKLSLSSTKDSYSTRDSISVQLRSANEEDQALGGSFSVAVTDDHQITKNEESDLNILSYFLLSSDLKGEIEAPSSYFTTHNLQNHEDLESLCLTQGWVSYLWHMGSTPKFAAEKEFIISGRIVNLSNKPVAKAKITIFGRNKTIMFGDTTTNEKGEFIFKNLPPLDSAIFVLKALNSKGKLGTLGFEVNEFKPTNIRKKATQLDEEDNLSDSILLNFVAVKQQELKSRPGGGIALKEVNITGKKTIKGSKNLNGPGEADQIITAEEIAKAGKMTLRELLLTKVNGFTHGFRRYTLIKDYFLSFNRISFIVDGIPFWRPEFDAEVEPLDARSINDYYFRQINMLLNYITAEDVEGIEVMRHIGNAAKYKSFYDQLLAGGEERSYIEITTKSGQGPFLKKSFNTYLIKPPNYGDTRIFYSPNYSVASKNNKPDLRSTVYWQPNLVTNNKGEANFSFFSTDRKGTYTIWVEGSDMQGKFGVKTMKLTIK